MTIEQSYYEPLVYLVPESDAGMKLGNVLKNRMGISRTLMTRMKQTEQGITVNGARTYTDAVVQAGDRVEARMRKEESEDILPEPMELAILHEDDHLLILNKPPGAIVHPTHGHYTGTLANGVVWHWQQNGELVRFRPVHRLDQETSGVLAIAKNPFVHQHISEQMQRGTVDKEYRAIVRGRLEAAEGTVDAPIARDADNPRVRIVTPEGDRAVTHFRTEEAHEEGTVVQIRLETGRTHQIRVHMRHLGHPLYGDKMYGVGGEAETGIIPGREEALLEPSFDEEREGIARQALHAEKLAFVHPGTGERMTFTAPLPLDMQHLIERLRGPSRS
ncbi:RluA family pseudouridine synthase [Gorillibacterium sp. CAU 1737]|uniref:RluA family pseudouridine synthase n=1 Tax=Gorillibacterium sp. CAU 1737 TaxID=3140362 RepID=UPI0032610144